MIESHDQPYHKVEEPPSAERAEYARLKSIIRSVALPAFLIGGLFFVVATVTQSNMTVLASAAPPAASQQLGVTLDRSGLSRPYPRTEAQSLAQSRSRGRR